MAGIQLCWYDKAHHAILWEQQGTITWEMVFQEIPRLNKMASEQGRPVDLIIHLKSPHLPPNAISNLSKLVKCCNPHIKMRVLVGANDFVITMFTLAAKLAPDKAKDWYFANTLSEAQLILGQPILS